MPIASDTVSPAALQRSRSSSKPVSAMLPATRTVFMHSSVRGAMRIDARPGSSVGNRSATVGPVPS